MIFLLYAYNKAVKADLQADEKRVLRQLASELKEEIKRTFANKEF